MNEPTIATLARRPFARHVWGCRQCRRGVFRGEWGRWSRERRASRPVERCALGAALYADLRVSTVPELAPRVRQSWEPLRLHQSGCDDCRHVPDLDARFGGYFRLCGKGESLFAAACAAVRELAAGLGPAGGAELGDDLVEDEDDDLVEELEAAG